MYISSESTQLNPSPSYLQVITSALPSSPDYRGLGWRRGRRQTNSCQWSRYERKSTERHGDEGVCERVSVWERKGGGGFVERVLWQCQYEDTPLHLYEREYHMDRESAHVQRYCVCFLTAKGYIQSLTESLQISTGGVKPAATVSFRSIQASLHCGSTLSELGAGN